MRGLDKGYIYPCSKSDVRKAFGPDFEGSAHFGMYLDFESKRTVHRCPKIGGKVIVELCEGLPSFYSPMVLIYRVHAESYSDDLRDQLREMMSDSMKPWLEKTLARPEPQRLGQLRLLVELDSGELKVHEWQP